MAANTTTNEAPDLAFEPWLERVNRGLQHTIRQAGNEEMRTPIVCQIEDGETVFCIPPEMADSQPVVLRYLHAMAVRQKIKLVENRRELDIKPDIERRRNETSDLAIGISLLLKQTGLPGPAHALSAPHMLKPGNRRIPIATLFRIAHATQSEAKKVIFVPNKLISGYLTNTRTSMVGYACQAVTKNGKNTITCFEADGFQALGYLTGDQFVVHVFFGGGSSMNPRLWCEPEMMLNNNLRCQVLPSEEFGQDYGLIYQTLYIDMEKTLELDSLKQTNFLSKSS